VCNLLCDIFNAVTALLISFNDKQHDHTRIRISFCTIIILDINLWTSHFHSFWTCQLELSSSISSEFTLVIWTILRQLKTFLFCQAYCPTLL